MSCIRLYVEPKEALMGQARKIMLKVILKKL